MQTRSLKQIKFLSSVVFAFAMAFSSGGASQTNEEASQKDLKNAFQSLKRSMKQATPQEVKSNDPLDTALDLAFNPLPDEVLNSDVNLDKVDTSEVQKAWKEINEIAVNEEIEIEYRQKGTALSLLLWNGSRSQLQSVLGNILKQLYSDKDSRRYRFLVNSSPVPYIEARNVDLNEEKRIAVEQAYERDMAMANRITGATGIPRVLKKEEVPAKPGVEIRISAGMFATFKNVDEMAGQLAKVLATLNPGIYGVQEDTGFTRNQKYFELINQIIDGSESATNLHAQKKRADVIAELSAIERLAAGGFNPWALYYYEERVFSWMADVFLESPNHGLGRFLVDSEAWRLKDWSRPLRMQLQSYYVAYLQSKERGRNMRRVDTEWSTSMKFIRLRLKLYTKPFFSGTLYQFGVTGSMVAGYLFFPEISHWALAALHLTTTDNSAVKEMVQNPGTIGQIAKQGHQITQDILNNSYLSSSLSSLTETAKSAIVTLDRHFSEIIYATGFAISAGVIAKYKTYIAEFLNAFVPKINELPEQSSSTKKSALENGENASEDILDSREITEIESVPEQELAEDSAKEVDATEGESKDKIVVSLAGEAVTIHTRLKGFGQYLVSKRMAAIAAYARTQERISRTSEASARMWVAARENTYSSYRNSKVALVLFAKTSRDQIQSKTIAAKDSGIKTAQALVRFAKAGRDLTVSLSKAAANSTVAGSVSAWNSLVRIAEATPGVIADKTEKSTRMVIGIGKTIGMGAAKGTYVTAKYGTMAFVGLNRFVFITAPVGLTKGGIQLIANGIEKRNQRKVEKEKAKQEKKQQQAVVNDELSAGSKRTLQFLTDPSKSPRDVYEYMSELERGVRTGFVELRKFGLNDQTQVPFTIIKLLERWIELAKSKGYLWDEVYAVEELIAKQYHWMSEDQKQSTTIKKLGIQLVEMLIEKANYEYVAGISKNESKKNVLFLADMLFAYDAITAKVVEDHPEISLESVVRIIGKSTTSSPQLTQALILYERHIDSIFIAATNGQISDSELSAFILRVYNLSSLKRIPEGLRFFAKKEIRHLSSIRRARIAAVFAKDHEIWGNLKLKRELQEAFDEQSSYWVTKAKSISDLTAMIEKDCAEFAMNPELFRDYLLAHVLKRPELIQSYQEFELLFAKDYYWSNQVENIQSTPLERPLVALLKLKRGQYGDSPAWKYDPIISERIHNSIREKLISLHQYPKSFTEIEAFWKTLTSRGVSTLTDDLLSQLLKAGSERQIQELENYAVREGRVFDQGLRDEFAIRQIKKSVEYAELMKVAAEPGTDRTRQIYTFVQLAQSLMSDLGIRYVELLEEISNRIHSTYAEAELIHEYKAKSLVSNIRNAAGAVSDSRLQMLHEILPYIKRWSAKNQYEFLLYLRGSIDATDFIKDQFPKFGPERIRKIYQGLPLESATAVVNLYLQETILARKEVNEGYGKKMIDYLVKGGSDSETQKYAGLLLEGLLVGIDRAHNKPFQKQVLSALIAMKPNETASVGETMKLILEQFPGVGPKIGQFLVATGLLSEDINLVLRKTQDQTLPPKRFDIYNDLSQIVGKQQNIGVEIVDLLGSGSLKYSMRGREIQNGTELALQVFREDVQNNAELQIKVLNGMINYLIEKDGKKWAFLQVIVDGAMSAVSREKRFDRESQKTAIARNKLYSGFSDSEFTVAVPEQDLVNDRLLVSRYAKGTSFFKLSAEDQKVVARKLLEMESKLMYSEKGRVSWYDTDRHAGNYLIDVVLRQGRKHYVITPIDFGQLTYIRHEQRQKVADLFAMAAMLGNMGSNEWLGLKIADTLQLNADSRKALISNLKEFFPVADSGKKSVITSYFTLLAAINEAARTSSVSPNSSDFKNGKLDLVYTDFVRAIIQLNQYEMALGEKALGDLTSPRKILESAVKDQLAKYLQEVQLSRTQEIAVKVVNFKKWLQWKFSQKQAAPEFISIRMSREQLEKFSIDGEASKANQKSMDQERISKERVQNSRELVRCEQVFSI